MKVFAATMVILIIMTALICINCSFVLNTANRLEEHLDKIGESPQKADAIEDAEKYWERARPFVALTANYGTVEEIDRRFIGLKSFRQAGREADFNHELELFRDTLNKIRRAERLFN